MADSGYDGNGADILRGDIDTNAVDVMIEPVLRHVVGEINSVQFDGKFGLDPVEENNPHPLCSGILGKRGVAYLEPLKQTVMMPDKERTSDNGSNASDSETEASENEAMYQNLLKLEALQAAYLQAETAAAAEDRPGRRGRGGTPAQTGKRSADEVDETDGENFPSLVTLPWPAKSRLGVRSGKQCDIMQVSVSSAQISEKVCAVLGYQVHEELRASWREAAAGAGGVVDLEAASTQFVTHVLHRVPATRNQFLHSFTEESLRETIRGTERYAATVTLPLHLLSGLAVCRTVPKETLLPEPRDVKELMFARDDMLRHSDPKAAEYFAGLVGSSEEFVLSPQALPVNVLVECSRGAQDCSEKIVERLAQRLLAMHLLAGRRVSQLRGVLLEGWDRARVVLVVEDPRRIADMWVTPPTNILTDAADMVLLSLVCSGTELRDFFCGCDADARLRYQDRLAMHKEKRARSLKYKLACMDIPD